MSEETPKNGSKVRPRDVGIPAMTYLAGILTSRLSGEHALPIETFNWIIDKGALGLALVSLALMGWAYFRERHERTAVERLRTSDQASFSVKLLEVEDRCHDRMEARSLEQAPLLRKMAKVLAINSQVIADRVITEEQLREIGDDTPEDAIKLPPKKRGGSGEHETKPKETP